MSPAKDDLAVPKCGLPKPGEELLGWGNYGLHFSVPENGVKIARGSDVDYIRYAITLQGGGSYLELWFGPNAFSPEPHDKLFVESADFSQRNLRSIDGQRVGIDSWGRLHNGSRWRQSGVSGDGGAIYENASTEEAHLFDQIINSICTVPWPGIG
jgi:hypothetical protein